MQLKIPVANRCYRQALEEIGEILTKKLESEETKDAKKDDIQGKDTNGDRYLFVNNPLWIYAFGLLCFYL